VGENGRNEGRGKRSANGGVNLKGLGAKKNNLGFVGTKCRTPAKKISPKGPDRQSEGKMKNKEEFDGQKKPKRKAKTKKKKTKTMPWATWGGSGERSAGPKKATGGDNNVAE